ncbi:hypothetical protein GUITHDRAFT_108332 [Guillardia theta CCMP2712]|uniref:Zn(2)-C6 fungal-type domain-containing protein n=2 Tax=Guillardia theta TaxID=55529 RepID=L1JBJ5_GUITC|nr:hypothetical protein GUITHDRAFT_108332 [Guillardia theta CCMP2712]EKX45881.1 hypothetical protein GUITHDRAFT_108332 [Guillardia theta CCMP2712]|eukprot:XP_005832861.1 hypothetical protein GUITHDRAFT_108332 [Guillardia theta CCMP2712]
MKRRSDEPFDPEYWNKPGNLYKMRRWLSSSRHPTKKACDACRSAKAKCQDSRPCKRCIAKGIFCSGQDTAIEPEEQVESSQIAMKDGVMLIYNDVAFRDTDVGKLPQRILRLVWEWSFVANDLEAIFNAMPSSLQTSIANAVSAVETMASMNHVMDVPSGHQLMNDTCANAMFSTDTSGWDSTNLGYQCFTWDPILQKRTSVNCNAVMADFFGLSREEWLAKMAGNDGRIPTTDLRYLCMILEDLLCMSNPTVVHYLRFSKNLFKQGHKEGVLVRSTTKKLYDSAGRVCKVAMSFAPISAEEYDRALLQAPDLCEPMMKALDDEPKSGIQLIEDGTLAQKESIHTLCRTPNGKKKLDKLASIIDSRFAHLVSLANGLRANQSNFAHHQNPPFSAPEDLHPPMNSTSTTNFYSHESPIGAMSRSQPMLHHASEAQLQFESEAASYAHPHLDFASSSSYMHSAPSSSCEIQPSAPFFNMANIAASFAGDGSLPAFSGGFVQQAGGASLPNPVGLPTHSVNNLLVGGMMNPFPNVNSLPGMPDVFNNQVTVKHQEQGPGYMWLSGTGMGMGSGM